MGDFQLAPPLHETPSWRPSGLGDISSLAGVTKPKAAPVPQSNAQLEPGTRFHGHHG